MAIMCYCERKSTLSAPLNYAQGLHVCCCFVFLYMIPPNQNPREKTSRRFDINGVDTYLKALREFLIELYFHAVLDEHKSRRVCLFICMWFMKFKRDTAGSFY